MKTERDQRPSAASALAIALLVKQIRKTGKLKKGTNEVTKVVEKGIAKLVLIAEDVNPKEIVMHIKPLCDEKDILCISVPSKEELGAAAGLNLPTSAVAVIKEGESKDIIKELRTKLMKNG